MLPNSKKPQNLPKTLRILPNWRNFANLVTLSPGDLILLTLTLNGYFCQKQRGHLGSGCGTDGRVVLIPIDTETFWVWCVQF